MQTNNHLFQSFCNVGGMTTFHPEEKQKQIQILQTFECTTCQSIYVLDFKEQNFFYVSEHPLFLCGHTVKEVKETGFAFYSQHLSLKEQEKLKRMNGIGEKYYRQLSIEEKKECTMSYKFHLERKGHPVLFIHHQLTPLLLTPEGEIRLALCGASLTGHTSENEIEFHKKGEKKYITYSLSQEQWKEKEDCCLNEKEKDILWLSAQGCTMHEIANRVFLSENTIKFYKRRLFLRLGVKNVTEAFSLAMSHHLI